ncbi:MAG: uracil-DNA glycosylase [Limimaricola soesokkakensis]|uniref:uracil-DNA glycosylase n=1 Tax=Limimaricola soesokkakensis TaxID=1343159 RepID=UPI0040593633
MTERSELVDNFVTSVAALRFDNAFNPYADTCVDFDIPGAPEVRRKNLARALDAALATGVESVWVARDLGYRGGRRTGLALTDEAHLNAHAALLGAKEFKRSTRGPATAERTATVIWRMLMQIGKPIFLWNVFPLHPHGAGRPMSNRPHTRAERQACRHIMVTLLDLLDPKAILAIGRDAEAAMADLDIAVKQVRHPSYGGQPEFIDSVSAYYGLQKREPKQETLSLFE